MKDITEERCGKAPPIHTLRERNLDDFPIKSIWLNRSNELVIVIEHKKVLVNGASISKSFPLEVKPLIKVGQTTTTLNSAGMFDQNVRLMQATRHDLDLIRRISEDEYPEYFL